MKWLQPQCPLARCAPPLCAPAHALGLTHGHPHPPHGPPVCGVVCALFPPRPVILPCSQPVGALGVGVAVSDMPKVSAHRVGAEVWRKCGEIRPKSADLRAVSFPRRPTSGCQCPCTPLPPLPRCFRARIRYTQCTVAHVRGVQGLPLHAGRPPVHAALLRAAQAVPHPGCRIPPVSTHFSHAAAAP